MSTILVVDDELGIRALLSEILADEGHTVELAENASQARAARERSRPDLVLLDIWMPDVDGITLLKEWGSAGLLTMPVIMMSGHGTIDTATEASRYGASAFLEKPITLQKLLKAVDQALSRPSGPRAPAAAGELANRSNALAAGPGAARLAGGATAPAATGAGASAAAAGGSMAGVVTVVTSALPPPRQAFDLDRPLREARDAFEKSYFEFHLANEGGSMTRVADKTGLERTHLYRKLKQLGVDLTRTKRNGQG
ncbi:MAG: response regulator [Betaproteobacteria bacterium]|jgi:DNA-binding NtrC family response regulator